MSLALWATIIIGLALLVAVARLALTHVRRRRERRTAQAQPPVVPSSEHLALTARLLLAKQGWVSSGHAHPGGRQRYDLLFTHPAGSVGYALCLFETSAETQISATELAPALQRREQGYKVHIFTNASFGPGARRLARLHAIPLWDGENLSLLTAVDEQLPTEVTGQPVQDF